MRERGLRAGAQHERARAERRDPKAGVPRRGGERARGAGDDRRLAEAGGAVDEDPLRAAEGAGVGDEEDGGGGCHGGG